MSPSLKQWTSSEDGLARSLLLCKFDKHKRKSHHDPPLLRNPSIAVTGEVYHCRFPAAAAANVQVNPVSAPLCGRFLHRGVGQFPDRVRLAAVDAGFSPAPEVTILSTVAGGEAPLLLY